MDHMTKNRILVIEDNEDYRMFYQDLLGNENKLTFVPSLSQLEQHVDNEELEYDLILADLILSDGHFLEWITTTKSTLMEKTPTIIVSFLEDTEALRTSFEWGASDYLIKPFRRNEILVKVEKARRSFVPHPDTYPNEFELKSKLTAIESRIFKFFSTRLDQYVGRQEITQEVWRKTLVDSKTMDVHFSNLRRKMKGCRWKIECNKPRGWKMSRIRSLK